MNSESAINVWAERPKWFGKINIEEYALNGILKADVVDQEREKTTRARIEYLNKLLRGI